MLEYINMKNTVPSKPFGLLFLILVVSAVFLAGCNIWGAFDNPFDPKGVNYASVGTGAPPSTADAVINIAAIPGVTAPVTGATPVTTITDTQYTGTVSWNGTPTTFAASTTYTATITLTAKAGFTLTGVAADFFTVTGATSDVNLVNSGVVTAVFPATPTAVVFNGLTANGTSGSVTTTELTLSFDVEPTNLALSDITLTGATKGALSGSGITRTLTISNITVANVTVTLMNPVGLSILLPTKNVVVYKTYTVGDIGPSGVGKVFYISGGGWNGMEAAPSTWSGGASDPTAQWKTAETSTTGTQRILGTGYVNTYSYMTNVTHPAAELCRNYRGGGLSGWFLPSDDELIAMYLVAASIDNLIVVSDTYYWSSSENTNIYAWSLNTYTGNSGSYSNKIGSYYVRPIRQF